MYASESSRVAVDAPLRVLVVDDDDSLVFNLGAFLDNHGFKSTCVQSIAAATDAILARQVDIALIDYRLGRDSGLELIQEIRKHRPGFPIVLMSAYLDEWVECMVRGFRPARALRKPFVGSEIIATIRETMEAARR